MTYVESYTAGVDDRFQASRRIPYPPVTKNGSTRGGTLHFTSGGGGETTGTAWRRLKNIVWRRPACCQTRREERVDSRPCIVPLQTHTTNDPRNPLDLCKSVWSAEHPQTSVDTMHAPWRQLVCDKGSRPRQIGPAEMLEGSEWLVRRHQQRYQ